MGTNENSRGAAHGNSADFLARVFPGKRLRKQIRSVGSVFGTFLKTTDQNGVRQSSSDGGGILASYRYFFTNHHGVEVNYGYSRKASAV
jgi:hypothetical protein